MFEKKHWNDLRGVLETLLLNCGKQVTNYPNPFKNFNYKKFTVGVVFFPLVLKIITFQTKLTITSFPEQSRVDGTRVKYSIQ